MCRFHVPAPGASSPAYVAYITRPGAVLDRGEGIRLLNFPPEIMGLPSTTYSSERCALIAWATTREAMERMNAHSRRGSKRTHYRAVLSFEDAVETSNALRLAAAWVVCAFPRASALLSLHRDTDHPHVHIWLDARQTDGRKIDLSARQYRQLDEMWARLYCRERGQDEREYLLKKWQTERKKQIAREHKVKEGVAHETAQEKKGRESLGREQHGSTRGRNERAASTSPVGRDGQLFNRGRDRAAARAAATAVGAAPAARLAPPEQKPPERIKLPDQRDRGDQCDQGDQHDRGDQRDRRDEFDGLLWER